MWQRGFATLEAARQVWHGHAFTGHAPGHAGRQRFSLDDVDPERQVAGFDTVTQVGTLRPVQPRGLNDQQGEVRERPGAAGGARAEPMPLGKGVTLSRMARTAPA